MLGHRLVMAVPNRQFKVLVVGCPGVGKTALLAQLTSGVFPSAYEPTRGVRDHVVRFSNDTALHCFDVPGESIEDDMIDEALVGAHAALLMFDVTNRISYKSVPEWWRKVQRVCGDIPMALVGSKVDDDANRKVSPKMLIFHRKVNIPYFEVSSAAMYNVARPIAWLVAKLLNDPSLAVRQINSPGLPQVTIDMEVCRRVEAQLALCYRTKLILDDGEDEL
jgi:GTP-binding nuclear protein Ran